MIRLSFYPVAESYLLVAVAALALLAILALGPWRRDMSLRRRVTLAGLRLAVVIMVILAMLRPTLVHTTVGRQAATLVILADTSRSMSVPDGVGGKTRWDSMREALDSARGAIANLAEQFEVKAYTFDAQTRPAQLLDGDVTLGKTPNGDQTAIGAAMEDVLRDAAGKRLLGILLLSDGSQRALAPRDAAPQTAAARMESLGFPIYTVPLGKAGGLGQAKDAAVKELLVPPNVFVKNELAANAQVRVDGYANRQIPVKLLFETSPGKMELVEQKAVEPTAEGQQIPIEFHFVPETPGQYKLTVEVPQQAGELVTTNNQMSTFVDVLRGGLNVLYIEGALRVEQKFIRRSLDASPEINVDYVRVDPRRPESRPADLAQRFRPGKYLVYIVGDVDSTAFSEAEMADLARSVYRGAGLIMLGGFHSFGPGGYATTPLAAVLPIQMERLERQRFDEAIRQDLHVPGPVRIEPTPFGHGHFALMLAAGVDQNRAAWNELPALDGANRFAAVKPGAVVLAASDQGAPILVAQQYGDGRVLAFAGDSTWHWWMRGFGAAHKRFWRQVVLWLAKKDEAAEGRVWVKLPERRVFPAQRLHFTAGAQSADGQFLADAQYDAELVLPDGKTQPLRVVAEGEQMVGSIEDTHAAGDYAVRLKATYQGQLVGAARARFLVVQQDLELDNPSADVGVMENLAATTRGEAVPAEQLPKILQTLAQRAKDLEVRTERKDTLWDRWPSFLVLVGLLGAEWYLRKRWGLV